MFYLITTVAFLFLLWRWVLPLPCHKRWKWLLAIILLLISQTRLIQKLIFGSMFAAELPRWLVIGMGWSFFVFALLMVATLLKDLLLILCFLTKQQSGQAIIRHRFTHALIALLSLGIASLGVHNAIQVPDVRSHAVTIPSLPSELEGLKVVQLTDLHISSLFPQVWTEQVVERVNALDPDLILITGDFIDGTTQDRANDVRPLSQLRARYGVYGILGNHEYYFNALDWKSHLESLGITMLYNQHQTLSIHDALLTLAGVTDESATRFHLPAPDLQAALQGAPTDVPIILLKHQPQNAQQSAQAGVDLQLSGHTHGGMVVGLDQIVKRANQGFVSGFYTVDNMQLYVSNGTALWNGFPVRLGVPPEITLFTLHAPTQ